MTSKNKIIISVVVLLVLTFILQFAISKFFNLNSNRQVASFGDRKSEEKIKWEQDLAKELANGKIKSFGTDKLNWQDHFIKKYFNGAEEINYSQGQINHIVLKYELNSNDQLNQKFNFEKIVQDYAELKYKSKLFKDVTSDTKLKEFFIYNDQGQVIETVKIKLSENHTPEKFQFIR